MNKKRGNGLGETPTTQPPEEPRRDDQIQEIDAGIREIHKKIAAIEAKPKSLFDKLIALLAILMPFIVGISGICVTLYLKKIESSAKDSEKSLAQSVTIYSEIISGGQDEFVGRAAELQRAQDNSEQLIREGELLAEYIDPLTANDPMKRKLAINAILTAMPRSGHVFLEALKKDMDQEYAKIINETQKAQPSMSGTPTRRPSTSTVSAGPVQRPRCAEETVDAVKEALGDPPQIGEIGRPTTKLSIAFNENGRVESVVAKTGEAAQLKLIARSRLQSLKLEPERCRLALNWPWH
ncbi:MAG: hypothetical protein GY854_33165 [Deltaproteobacteria bacterium]|nr:hypothetical protein [Deltaproteobacteria bacterium]